MKKFHFAPWCLALALILGCGQSLDMVSVPVKECRLETPIPLEGRRGLLRLSGLRPALPPLRARFFQAERGDKLELALENGETVGEVTVYQNSRHRVRVESGKVSAVELYVPVRGTSLHETVCITAAQRSDQ